jgi:endonuclease/exonuclease/phosphatase (EEP) superfamily protein YafD
MSGLPLDHVLTGPGISVLDYRVEAGVGSDHFPVTATFRLSKSLDGHKGAS